MKEFKIGRNLLFITVSVFLLFGCTQVGRQTQVLVAERIVLSEKMLLPERVVLTITQPPFNQQAVSFRTLSPMEAPCAQIVPLSDLLNPDKSPVTVLAQTSIVELDKKQYAHHHSVVFDSLLPDTVYAYRVGESPHWSEWSQFKTASKKSAPFTFLYFGDVQKQAVSMCSQMFRTALQKEPEAKFWLFGGDMVNNGPDDPEWGEFFDALGWMPRTIPLVPVPGNHEYPDRRIVTKEAYHITKLWRPHFTLPENSPQGLEETVYHFEYQGVCFVVLNGNEQIKEQAAWLEALLLKNRQPWIIVAVHQPVYSISERKNRTDFRKLFVPIFDRFSVDLVLQGHDHGYARSFPLKNNQVAPGKEKGTVYVISNAGPKAYTVSARYDPLMARTGSGKMLFQSIRVDKNRLEFTAYNIMKQIEDLFEIQK